MEKISEHQRMWDEIAEEMKEERLRWTFVFLFGLSDREDEVRLYGLRRCLDSFLKSVKESVIDDVVEVIGMQYATEGVKTVFHWDSDNETEGSELLLSAWGTPSEPYSALEHVYDWANNRKEEYKSAGIDFHQFQIFLFPDYYDATDKRHEPDGLLEKMIRMRRLINITSFQFGYSHGKFTLDILKKNSDGLSYSIDELCDASVLGWNFPYFGERPLLWDVYEILDMLLGLGELERKRTQNDNDFDSW